MLTRESKHLYSFSSKAQIRASFNYMKHITWKITIGKEETNWKQTQKHKRVATYSHIIIKDCNFSLAQKKNSTTKLGKNKVNTENGENERKQQCCKLVSEMKMKSHLVSWWCLVTSKEVVGKQKGQKWKRAPNRKRGVLKIPTMSMGIRISWRKEAVKTLRFVVLLSIVVQLEPVFVTVVGS